MAITQDYVSAAGTEGNDYKGASFADGAYAKATKTLTKAGAFTASKVNHYIYITGTHITSGYYKISDVTGAPNAVVLATDASSDGNDSTDVHCTQADGSTTLPWRSLQGAFDLCTRNATDGNQVNLKAGTAQVNAAALDLTTFIAGGALSATAPLVVRGYTAATNDGGVGEIDCNSAAMWSAANYTDLFLADLSIYRFGNNAGISTGNRFQLYRCSVYRPNQAEATSRPLISCENTSFIMACHLYNSGSVGTTNHLLQITGGVVYGNCFDLRGATYGSAAIRRFDYLHPTVVIGNVAIGDALEHRFVWGGGGAVIGNAAYHTGSASSPTVGAIDATMFRDIVVNNIVSGWNGVGASGVLATNIGVLGYNAFYNCTLNNKVTDQLIVDLTANDVTLAADPFVDAANGDFSLTAAAKTALRGLGWPGAYLGAHANTDGHVTVGAIQYGEAESGGGMLVGNKRGNKE